MKNALLLTFILLLGFTALNAQNNEYSILRVNNPQTFWRQEGGTIEDASFIIKPQGFYTLVDMYFTFSARNTSFPPSDQLEVVLDFSLPEGAFFVDSWLWIEDIIIKAAIIDRWTASGIYEEIVGRQRDPSILFKNTQRDYQLRIFPMLASSSRKVKLSYMVPNTWTTDEVLTSLPIHLLRDSWNPVQTLQIRYFTDELNQGLSFSELSNLNITKTDDPVLGTYEEVTLSDPRQFPNLTISTPAPYKDGVYLSRFSDDENNFYQMAILPSEVFDLPQAKKNNVMVLVDFDEKTFSLTSQEDLLQVVKQNLKRHLLPKDNFNIMFANASYDVQPVSEKWMSGSSATIDSVFEAMGSRPIVNYNNIPPLLFKGIDFLQNNGDDGQILLISDSDEEGELETANQLLNDILARMGADPFPINVMDLMPWTNRQSYFINGRRYEGNEYFYDNLTRLTTGNIIRQVYTQESIANNLNELFENTASLVGTIDLYTTLNQGFCYNRYELSESGEFTNLNQPLLQIGKFEGEFPFVIEASGEFDDIVFSESIAVDYLEANPADSLLEEIWVGNFLGELERQSQDNSTTAEIINRSISERVLSLYTAFIALEPSLGGEPCFDCVDESVVTDVEDLPVDSLFMIEAYPNPFSDRVIVNITFEDRTNWEDFNFAIYNTLGQEVKRFNQIDHTNSNELRLEWDATDGSGQAVPNGIYFFSIQTGNERVNHKLIKMN